MKEYRDAVTGAASKETLHAVIDVVVKGIKLSATFSTHMPNLTTVQQNHSNQGLVNPRYLK